MVRFFLYDLTKCGYTCISQNIFSRCFLCNFVPVDVYVNSNPLPDTTLKMRHPISDWYTGWQVRSCVLVLTCMLRHHTRVLHVPSPF